MHWEKTGHYFSPVELPLNTHINTRASQFYQDTQSNVWESVPWTRLMAKFSQPNKQGLSSYRHTHKEDRHQSRGILTYSLLADNTPGLFNAWWASGGGTSLSHCCCLAWLISAPAFGEGTIHNLPLALWTDTFSMNGGKLRMNVVLSVHIHWYFWYLCK